MAAAALGMMTACSKHSPQTEGGQPGGPAPSASAMVITTPFAGFCDEGLEKCETDCKAGSAEQCRKLAVAYSSAKGGAKLDETRATALFENACNLGDPISCVAAGRMYEYKHGVPKDDTRAASLYEKACQMKDVGGCYNQALMLRNGRGVPENKAAADEILGRLCDAGAQGICAQLGVQPRPE